jgi:hypothetical protein
MKKVLKVDDAVIGYVFNMVYFRHEEISVSI